jgi:carbon monoxide dehydrogenase subunit G
MKIENAFDVPVSVPEAWSILTDIEGIAPCMPGAKLTDVLGDGAYRGQVSVRLGPVALTFDGTARFLELDADANRARVAAEGSDKKGRGGASAQVTFALAPLDGGTRVTIETDLTLSGAVAQYGRGAGMITELASRLVAQFAESLRAKIAAERSAGTGHGDGIGGSEIAPQTVRDVPEPEPIPVFGLLVRSFWSALSKAVRRLFGGG